MNIINSSGLYECVNGQLVFYNTPFNAKYFIEHSIFQNQQILDYFLQRPLNPCAKPYTPTRHITNLNNDTANTLNEHASTSTNNQNNKGQWIVPNKTAPHVNTSLPTTNIKNKFSILTDEDEEDNSDINSNQYCAENKQSCKQIKEIKKNNRDNLRKQILAALTDNDDEIKNNTNNNETVDNQTTNQDKNVQHETQCACTLEELKEKMRRKRNNNESSTIPNSISSDSSKLNENVSNKVENR